MARVEHRCFVRDDHSDRLSATQGSQPRMRLLGGWFIAADQLPKCLAADPADDGYEVRVEDAFGPGILDRKLRRKYEQAFAEVERQLRA